MYYEAEDLLELYVTDGGTGRVDLLRLNGDTGLDGLADDRYAAWWADIPPAWKKAVLVLSTSSNSSAGSEGFDLAVVEFTGPAAEEACAAPSPAGTFIRGDATGDRRLDLADPVAVLFHLFAGGAVPALRPGSDGGRPGLRRRVLLSVTCLSGPAPRPAGIRGISPRLPASRGA